LPQSSRASWRWACSSPSTSKGAEPRILPQSFYGISLRAFFTTPGNSYLISPVATLRTHPARVRPATTYPTSLPLTTWPSSCATKIRPRLGPAKCAFGGTVKLNRSWFSLLTFCASASLLAGLAIAVVFTGASVVVAAAAPAAVEEPNPVAARPMFSGVITDSQCGARHAEGSGKSPAECTLACVRNGAKYSLVNGGKKYALDGNADELGKWAGQRATLAGTRSGETIKVSSVGNPR
jgi:hypothetical protein